MRVAEAGSPVLGTADPRYLYSESEKAQNFLYDESVKAGAGIVRINAFWFQLAPDPPRDPSNPRDPGYFFGSLDAAVRSAEARGLDVVLTLQRAPRWAENGSDEQDRGAFKPDPSKFAAFATAVASRYSGKYDDPRRPGKKLPRVTYFQVWNEANLNKFYAPQIENGKSVSADNYRRLLNLAYARIKRINRSNKVIVAGSGPRAPTEQARTAPKEWWADLLCLSKDHRKGCAPAKFDIFDHHPITVDGPPTQKGKRGEILIADYTKLTKLLRKAEKRKTVGGPKKHHLWATEIYWETNPPDRKKGFPEATAARYLQQGIYLLARQQVDVILNFFMIDAPLTVPGDVANVQGGLLYASGKRKDSFTAFRFPFVTDRLSAKKTRAWGIAPKSGKLTIERKAGKRWKKVAKLRVKKRKVFQRKLKVKGKAQFRARMGKERSLVWKHGRR